MLDQPAPQPNPSTLEDAQQAMGFLLDWDGCCAIDNQLVPEAAAFLRQNASRTAIVSNNSTNTVEDFCDILSDSDIEIGPDQIVLAGIEALEHAANDKPAKTLILGDPRMRAVARSLGIGLVQQGAELVIVLRDTRFSYRRLERAVNAIRSGAQVIVANPDTTHPANDGRLMPETGSILAAIQACVELPENTKIIGKPSAHLYRKGCNALGLPLKEVMMIGDNPLTDLRGARALGMKTCLVDIAPNAFFAALRDKLRSA